MTNRATSASWLNVPLGTREARPFLQRRMRMYLGLVAVLSGGFYVANTAIGMITHSRSLVDQLRDVPHLLHLAQVALMIVTWVAVARLELDERKLRAVDALATVLGLAIFQSMVVPNPEILEYFAATLTYLAITLGRAIFVPSTSVRTAWINVLAGAPLLVFSAFSGRTDALGLTLYLGTWVAVGCVLATVASRIIFGLTERVREAHQLGQYTLHDRIGSGGMGEVYRAQHAMLRRPTAIKLLRPEAVGEDTLSRFEREVRLTARLTHPNTIAIYDYGRTPDGVFYYAMELLDGVDLQRLVDEHGPMPPERVVFVLEQVCASLAEAHALGMIHRDVKPANIVLCNRGRAHDVVKVLDFGLVKDLRGDAEVAVSKANTIAGTPLYLSPETIRGDENIDGRTDLYAIGLVGWFLLVGRPAFEGRSVVEVCGHHLHTKAPSPSEAGAHVDDDLEEVIAKCLEKSPEDRFADADALRAALRTTRAASGWSDARAHAWWKDRARSERPAKAMQQTGVLSIDFAARTPEETTVGS